MSFVVALVGRPNVGKSTLFNRLTGQKHALVDDRPGVTRDRRYGEGHIGPMEFTVIDTAGMEDSKDPQAMTARMMEMTRAGIEEADVVLLMVDGLAGITPDDEHFARWLRKQNKPTILLVNKAEGKRAAPTMQEAYRLGMGDPVPISAEHGDGLADLYDALDSLPVLKEITQRALEEADDEKDTPLQLAIIGRPNAGKSTLLNAFLGKERVLTGPEAGLTRDAIAVDWHWREQPFKLIDTAGLRRQSKRNEKLERLAAVDSYRAIQYAQVVVLLLDASCPLDKQDLKLAEHVIQEGRALVVAVNKWDLVDNEEAWMKALNQIIEKRFAAVRGVPMVTLSAQEQTGLDPLMEAVLEVYALWNRRIPTGELNRWLEGMLEAHPPPLSPSKRPIRLKYMTQIKTRPPTFALFATRKEKLPESYRRYLIQGIRRAFDLPAVPIRLQLRGSKNPYAKEE
jgi:GTP-binding protein